MAAARCAGSGSSLSFPPLPWTRSNHPSSVHVMSDAWMMAISAARSPISAASRRMMRVRRGFPCNPAMRRSSGIGRGGGTVRRTLGKLGGAWQWAYVAYHWRNSRTLA